MGLLRSAVLISSLFILIIVSLPIVAYLSSLPLFISWVGFLFMHLFMIVRDLRRPSRDQWWQQQVVPGSREWLDNWLEIWAEEQRMETQPEFGPDVEVWDF